MPSIVALVVPRSVRASARRGRLVYGGGAIATAMRERIEAARCGAAGCAEAPE
jgi:hypothetical protein